MTFFDVNCQLCPRMVSLRAEVQEEYPDYYSKPVPAFGIEQPRLLVVGLAPGKHGANRTGRPFTGDHAGILLYKVLHRFGFSNYPDARYSGDGLVLKDCRITNAVKCLPPENKPRLSEIKTCNGFLKAELQALTDLVVILVLGGDAHRAVIEAYEALRPYCDYEFAHGKTFSLPRHITLVDCYHCSQYNTNTGRLTEEMFVDVFRQVRELVDASD